MINVREIENKCLIALQALQDIMNEIGWSADNFYTYVEGIHATSAKERVAYFLREFRALSTEEDPPKNIFISNSVKPEQDIIDVNTILEDLWFFWAGYCVKFENFMEDDSQKMRVNPLKDEAQSLFFTKKNFRLQTETPVPRVNVTPQLSITVKLENGDVFELKAARTLNCKKLLKIYREYFARLCPI